MQIKRPCKPNPRMPDKSGFVWLGLLLATMLACSLLTPGSSEAPQDLSGMETASALLSEAGVSLEEALAAPTDDQRPETLRLLGPPDAFTLQWQELEGKLVRREEWSYFDFKSRFDFVDGELLWTVDIPPAVDGSIYAHAFDPLAFTPGMSIAEAKVLVGDPELIELPLDEADIPGGTALAGDQILLGFDRGKLVYVQTFVLSPEEAAPAATSPTERPVPTATARSAQPEILLSDRFNDPAGSAVPLFGAQYMTFAAEAGIGTITAKAPGVLPAMYNSPKVADFNATVSLLVPDPKPEAGYGLIFRAQESGSQLSEYYMLIARPMEGLLDLQQYVNGGVVDVAHVALPASQANVWQLTVRVQGSQLEAQANDGETLTVSDLTLLQPGKLALVLSSNSTADSVLFNEVRVEALNE